MRVLVVDDNATNRQILEKILSHWRMRPVAVDGAQAALALLQQAKAANDPFALMIVDCHMPDVDGFMLVEQIRKSPDLAGLITVMLTSGGQRGDGARCAELGIAAYLIKPVLQSDLLDALSRVLGSAYRSSGTGSTYYQSNSARRSRAAARALRRRQSREPTGGVATAGETRPRGGSGRTTVFGRSRNFKNNVST